jgi:hypothetical protein
MTRGGGANADRHRDRQRGNTGDQYSADSAAHQECTAYWWSGSVELLGFVLAAVFHWEFVVVVLHRIRQLRT